MGSRSGDGGSMAAFTVQQRLGMHPQALRAQKRKKSIIGSTLIEVNFVSRLPQHQHLFKDLLAKMSTIASVQTPPPCPHPSPSFTLSLIKTLFPHVYNTLASYYSRARDEALIDPIQPNPTQTSLRIAQKLITQHRSRTYHKRQYPA